MSSITTRVTAGSGATVKNAPLTNAEIDTNFINLNNDKSEKSTQVTNNSGVALNPGTVVYIDGSTGTTPTVTLASASDADGKTFAIVQDSIAIDATGRVVFDDYITSLNTSSVAEGAALWLGVTAGTYSATRPSDPNRSVLVGYVIKSHATEGIVLAKPQNGYDLKDINNVSTASEADGDILIYDASTSVWRNANKSSARTKLELYSITETTNKAIAMAIALG